MELITVPEFKKIQNKQRYKYLQLLDLNGQVIVALNSKVATVEDRMREIETRIPVQSDNVFIVKCKNSLSKNAKVDVYRLVRDITLAEQEPETINIEAISMPTSKEAVKGVNVRSYEEVLKLEIENNRLQLEVEKLEDKLLILQEQLDESIELSEEAGGKSSMFENAQAWMSSTLEMVAPMLDKHFELKERKLNLETVRLQRSLQQQPQAEPQAEQMDANAVNYTDEKIKAFVLALSETDSESAEAIKQVYNGAESMDQFYNGVKEFDETIFNELLNYINNG